MSDILSHQDVPRIAQVRLEQLVYTWANQTLTGPGFGVVGCSSGWPVRPERNQGGLGSQVRYLRQGAASLIREGSPAPETIAYRTDPEIGRILLIKLYLGQDAHGRDGRYLVHALVDRGNLLDPLTALSLACSPAITRFWPLDAAPDKELPSITVHVSPPSAPPALKAEERNRVRVILEALLTYTDRGERCVLITEDPERVPVLLGYALNCLPRRMQEGISFSTFESTPRDCGDALVFASPKYSNYRSVGLDQIIRHLPPVPPEAAATEFTKISTALIERFVQGSEKLPDDLGNIQELERYLRVETYFSENVQKLTPAQTIEILNSPLAHRWLNRPHAVTAVLTAINRRDGSVRSWLRPEPFDPELRRILREALLEIIATPTTSQTQSLAGTSSAEAYLILGGAPADLEEAIWERTIEPAILHRSIDGPTINRYSWIVEERLRQLEGPLLDASIECESLVLFARDHGHPFNQRMILRSWADPDYARSFDKYLTPLYEEFQTEAIHLLQAELKKGPSMSRWAQTIATLPREQSRHLVYLLVEHCDLNQGWLFDLVRSPLLDRTRSLSILSGYLPRILTEEQLVPPDNKTVRAPQGPRKTVLVQVGIFLLAVGIGTLITGAFQPAGAGAVGAMILALGLCSFASNLVLRRRSARRAPERHRQAIGTDTGC